MSGTTNSSYELRAPRRGRSGISADAWAPSQLELLTQQQIGQVDGSQMLGYHLNARTRQQNSADAYATLANSISQRQTQSDDLEARLTAAARLADARNPELAVAFTDVRNMIDPRFQETMDQLPEILPARQTATANYDNARANQANTEAGIMPPAGSTVDRYSLPMSPRGQGIPLDARVAATNAAGGARAPTLAALTGVANMYGSREQAVLTAVQQAEGRLLAQIGVRMDAGGNLITPPNVTPQQIADVRARARVEAEQAVDRAIGAAEQVYRAGGYGHIVPTLPPRGPGAPVAGAAAPPPPAPQTPSGPGPQTNAAPPQATQQTPAARTRITTQQYTTLMQSAPAGADPLRSTVNRDTGVVTFRNGAGQVIGQGSIGQ